MTKSRWWLVLPQWALILAFFVMVARHVLLPYDVFRDIIIGWGVYSYNFVFLDTDTVLSAVRCFNMGVDAYLTNPCDDLERVYTYSPLWMALRVFPMTQAWLVPIGLIVVCSFMASLFCLPRPHSLGGAVLLTLGVLSSTTVFAMERGNNDLVLFTLAACGAALCIRSSLARYASYACFLLAGLLKYYPMVLLAIAAKESPRRLVIVAATATAIALLFIVLLWGDLMKAFQNIPHFDLYFTWFGAEALAQHIALLSGTGEGAVPAIRLVMTGLALVAGTIIAFRPQTREAFDRLDAKELVFLIAGALLMTSCFFTALNIWYRTIHILLTLPALIVLSGRASPKRFNFALAGALALLWWNPVWRDFVIGSLTSDPDMQATYRIVFTLWRELCWWFLMVIYLSFIVRFCFDAPLVKKIPRMEPSARRTQSPA